MEIAAAAREFLRNRLFSADEDGSVVSALESWKSAVRYILSYTQARMVTVLLSVINLHNYLSRAYRNTASPIPSRKIICRVGGGVSFSMTGRHKFVCNAVNEKLPMSPFPAVQ